MTTNILTILGWLAFALNVWGNLALTTKGVSGWIIRIVCNLCWLPYGCLTHAWALVANHGLFILINAYGWWRWARDARVESVRRDDLMGYVEYLEERLGIQNAETIAAGERGLAAVKAMQARLDFVSGKSIQRKKDRPS